MRRSRPYFSRRALLHASLAGAGFLAMPRPLRASGLPANVTALAFDGNALLVAGETFLRSDDGGASWAPEPAADAGQFLALATHPDRPGRVISGLAAGGVAVSDDGGHNWNTRSGGLPDEAVIAIAVAAAAPDMIYATVRGDGLWQSEDAGRTWTFVMDRPWLADAERDPMALASVDLATGMGGIWIYAGTEAGLTRVPDCFCRWQDVQPGDAMDALVSGGPTPSEAPLPAGEPVHALASAYSEPETLYAALPSGVWTSRDGGVVWSRATDGFATALAVHPVDPDRIIAVTDGGLTQSRDGGITWAAFAAI